MEYRQLGRSGLRVSKCALGTMRGFNKNNYDDASRIINEALDNGLNFIDTSNSYGKGESEAVLGKALEESGRRDEAVIMTKGVWFTGRGPNDYGASRQNIIKACEESLRRLRTDHIDVYLLHVMDPNTPLIESLRALDTLVKQGKVRYIGTSKWPATRIVEALGISKRESLEGFVVEQPPYNILDRTAENVLIRPCERHGIAVTPYSPLAQGILSGKYSPDEAAPEGSRHSGKKPGGDDQFTRDAVEAANEVQKLAQQKGVSAAELSLAWLTHQPGSVIPIAGARTIEYMRSAVRACDIELTDEELAEIDDIVPPGRSVSQYYERHVYLPLRMNYSPEARHMGSGAYIPDNRNC